MVEAVLHWPRASGKTTEMCKLAKKHGGVVVTFSREQARSLHDRFGVEAFHWEDYVRARRARGVFRDETRRPVFVDEADIVLSCLLDGAVIAAASMTKPTVRDREMLGPSYIVVDDLSEDPKSPAPNMARWFECPGKPLFVGGVPCKPFAGTAARRAFERRKKAKPVKKGKR